MAYPLAGAAAVGNAPVPGGAAWPAALLARAMRVDPVAQAASFGRWWYDGRSGAMLLSLEAAELLGEHPGAHASLADCFSSVLPEDLVPVAASLPRACAPGHNTELAFRIVSRSDGLRWLRLIALPSTLEPGATLVEGILSDVTAVKHAAMREEFSFESTQLMIGTHTLDEAVSKVIELVCTDLGWDCGMYWSLETAGPDSGSLVCSHYWSVGERVAPDALLTDGSRRVAIAPGQGVVGAVWSSGMARWIEDLATDPAFLYPQYARQSGVHSGYAFPVAYDSDDGQRHRPGVLIFFSCLARQRTAQLPKLSAAIGGLIAQTAQRMAQQESIRRLAHVDGLTGLANRGHFHDLLDAACAAATRNGALVGMLYIDLDRFKPINDGLGHEVGDAVLRQFAQRLAQLTPDGGHAGRVGGDEFAVLVDPGQSPEQLYQLAERILVAARTRFLVHGRELAISASVGISLFPDHGRCGADLLRHADTAMYRVKRSGRNGMAYFSDGGEESAAASRNALLQQLSVEAQLLRAINGGELFMEYQPVFSTGDLRVCAVEALVRWRRPDGEIVPPDVFIPIAEQSHLIVAIGRWVIRQACQDLPHMHRAGLEGIELNVNMAAPEFLNARLPEELGAITDAAGIDPRHICLELTEGMMMNHADQVIPVMRALRQRGFQISVDDFGMGYSSLSRLKDLPISSLKIDRSFVAGLPHDQQDRAIVQTIVDIGRNMDLHVIAEGLETTAQLAHLRTLGCTRVQGYLTGRPMPLEALVRTHGVRGLYD